MNIFRKFFKKNDWIIIESYPAKYISWMENSYGYKVSEDTKNVTFYNIEYSSIRNEVRLSVNGETNQWTRDTSIVAQKKLAELNRLLLTENIKEILKKVK